MKNIDIIILNYNGEKILPQCLPSVVEAAKRSPAPCRVIVLDNKSTDKSIDYLQKNFADVKVIHAKENRVLFSYNDVVAGLDSDIVILLNNDVKAEPDFISPLISHFSSPDIFAVAPKQLSFSGKTHEGGKNKIEFRSGLVYSGPLYGEDPVVEQPGYTFYEANSAYDRKKFLELGGFDDIFFPFLWEDTDLGYRAWKTGYKFAYEPKSVIYHHESFTFDQEASKIKGRRVTSRRNSLIFTWKNITDPGMLLAHLCLLPFNLTISFLTDRALVKGFVEALTRLPAIFKARKNSPRKLSDRAVFRSI